MLLTQHNPLRQQVTVSIDGTKHQQNLCQHTSILANQEYHHEHHHERHQEQHPERLQERHLEHYRTHHQEHYLSIHQHSQVQCILSPAT